MDSTIEYLREKMEAKWSTENKCTKCGVNIEDGELCTMDWSGVPIEHINCERS